MQGLGSGGETAGHTRKRPNVKFLNCGSRVRVTPGTPSISTGCSKADDLGQPSSNHLATTMIDFRKCPQRPDRLLVWQVVRRRPPRIENQTRSPRLDGTAARDACRPGDPGGRRAAAQGVPMARRAPVKHTYWWTIWGKRSPKPAGHSEPSAKRLLPGAVPVIGGCSYARTSGPAPACAALLASGPLAQQRVAIALLARAAQTGDAVLIERRLPGGEFLR